MRSTDYMGVHYDANWFLKFRIEALGTKSDMVLNSSPEQRQRPYGTCG